MDLNGFGYAGSCREQTAPSTLKGWIRGDTTIGPVLDVKVTIHLHLYGIGIQIDSHFGSKLSLVIVCVCVPISSVPLLFVVLPAAVSSNFFQSTVADDRSNGEGWQTQRRKGWLSGQLRADKILAEAITIDGGKEWYCRFCSESNMWTSRRCAIHTFSLRFAGEV